MTRPDPLADLQARFVWTRDKRDKWTVRTMDLSLSAQFEHTVLVTESGPEILTVTEHGPKPGHRF